MGELHLQNNADLASSRAARRQVGSVTSQSFFIQLTCFSVINFGHLVDKYLQIVRDLVFCGATSCNKQAGNYEAVEAI